MSFGIAAGRVLCALLAGTFGAGSLAADPPDAEDLRLLRIQQRSVDEFMALQSRLEDWGHAASLAGLRAVLENGNRYDLGKYAYGFKRGGVGILPPEMEALMVRHFDARDKREVLVDMMGERGAKYRTRGMFDVLNAHLEEALRDPYYPVQRSYVVMRVMVATDLAGIEAPILQVLPRLPRADPDQRETPVQTQTAHGVAIMFLGRRKHAPAVAYLSARLQEVAPVPELSRSESVPLLSALGSIDAEALKRAALARLERLSASERSQAVDTEMGISFEHLQHQRAAFTVAQLAAWLAGTRFDDRFATSLLRALARNQDDRAIEIMIERLDAAARQRPPPSEVALTLALLAGLENQERLDYGRLSKALGGEMHATAAGAHLRLISRRLGDPRARVDLILYLGSRTHGAEALRLLVDTGDPVLWRRARDEMESLRQAQKIDAGIHAGAARQLDALLDDPDKHFAAKRARETASAFEAERSRLISLRIQANAARGTAAYADRMHAFIAASEQLELKYAGQTPSAGLRDDLRRAYSGLATHTRFVSKDPRRAVELYDRAAGYEEAAAGRGFLADVLAGDIYQFDLRSPADALRRYEAGLAKSAQVQAREHNEFVKGLSRWWAEWLKEEARFLRSGTAFRGPLTREQALGLFISLAYFPGDELRPVPAAGVVPLDALPPSRLSLPVLLRSLAGLDEREILRQLERHDPSGYWTACILGSIPYLDDLLKQPRDKRVHEEVEAMFPGLAGPARGLRSASSRFLKDRGITLKPAS